MVLYGSRDSGKTYLIAQKIVIHLMTEKYCKVVLMRKIQAGIRDSNYESIVSVIHDWKLDSYFHITASNLRIVCKLTGNTVLSRGLDKSHKLKSIKDPTIVWVEESNEITLDDYYATDLSIRAGAGVLTQLILTFNPEDEDCWINHEFFPPKETYEKEDGNFNIIKPTMPNTAILHTSYKDNRFCHADRVARYELLKLKNPKYYKMACLGLWGNGREGKVFEDVDYVNYFPEVWERENHGYGMDFGYSSDPSAVIECCISRGEIYVREKVYKTGLTSTMRTGGTLSFEYQLRNNEIQKDIAIYADSAEPKTIAEISSLGYNISGVKKGKGSVEAGIQSLKDYKINIVDSPSIQKEHKYYCWQTDKNGKFTNKPIDAFNHAWDAIRYWFEGAVTNLRSEDYDAF